MQSWWRELDSLRTFGVSDENTETGDLQEQISVVLNPLV